MKLLEIFHAKYIFFTWKSMLVISNERVVLLYTIPLVES